MTPLLETIIGIVFIFLIFSLITSWIVEYISMRLSRRGKMLRKFVFDALDDPFNNAWGPVLYAHPLIDVLHRYVERPSTGLLKYFYNNKLGVKRRLPAYIPSDQFAIALTDIVSNHSEMPGFVKDPDTNKYRLADTTIIGVRSEDGAALDLSPAAAFGRFVGAVNQLKASDLKTTLATIAGRVQPAGENPMRDLQQGIAAWYDNGMERLGGWYKRATRPWLFGFGLLVAIGFNVDTCEVISHLYADPQLRQSVVKAADVYVAGHPVLPSAPASAAFDSLESAIKALKSKIDPLALPIGWSESEVERAESVFVQKYFGRSGTYVVRPFVMAGKHAGDHWLGWLLTAFALSFGAPFWFDTLKRLVNMRSVGSRPAPVLNGELPR